MMVGHDERERDEQGQQRWRERFAKERRGLSASVDEALADPHLKEDFDDEPGDEFESMPQASRKMLIAPRLSLQSKQMPAVHIVPDKMVRPQPVEALPEPETNHVEALPVPPKKKRLAGRNTKVHLQAVPKTEKRSAKKMASSPGIIEPIVVEQAVPAVPLSEIRENESQTDKPVAVSLKKDERPARTKLAGTGQIAQGQAEITIENTLVSSSSVVMMNLLGNPGPVVVQYYTLLPDYGFKAHLSAPVTSNTPFNYVILLGELF
ncbi:MAG TPA: hypothetical protein VFQ36_22375 [Ktedonobacteraceae bacterium]|nr:hypothetical protein [Ktedonobacteraceae bacterium]